MSLPSFPDSSKIPSREEAINQILTSIAMEAHVKQKLIKLLKIHKINAARE